MNNVEKMVNELIKRGAILWDNTTIMMFSSFVKFKIQDDDVFYLDVISTPVEFRNQGSASNSLNALTLLAKECKVKIELTIATIEKNPFGFNLKGNRDIAYLKASERKNKIPVVKLKKFYSKFGFEPNGFVNKKQKMIFQ